MRVIFMLQLQLVKNKMAINSIHELWQKKTTFLRLKIIFFSCKLFPVVVHQRRDLYKYLTTKYLDITLFLLCHFQNALKLICYISLSL